MSTAEAYGLSWPGRADAVALATAPAHGSLVDDAPIGAPDGHDRLVEGDNLEVLKLLGPELRGAVRMIYIDPPYNTGRTFVYPDNFRTSGTRRDPRTPAESGARLHARWLSMMYPRLALAHGLLHEDGALFVSVDDTEVHNLRHLLDEQFGPENFVATVIWQKVYAPKSSARHFSEDHDYILVYARDAARWRPRLLPRTAAQDAFYKNLDGDPRGPWRADGMSARNFYSKGTYPVTTPSGRRIEGPPSGRYWIYAEERFSELDADGRIWWGEGGNNQPAVKRFRSEVKAGRVPQTLWRYEDVGHTQEAKKELLERVPFVSSDGVFETPKPLRLLERLIRIGTRPDAGDLVLDFFAGSGTTGEAVWRVNQEDGGDRRFVLVQLPEPTGQPDHPTIADITRARLVAAHTRLPSGAPQRGVRVSRWVGPGGRTRNG